MIIRNKFKANNWCRRGVELLKLNLLLPLAPQLCEREPSSSASSKYSESEMERRLNELLADGESLQLDSLKRASNISNIISLTTTETSTLLAQVAERIEDIRNLSSTRRDALRKLAEWQSNGYHHHHQRRRSSPSRSNKPVQMVSPEKKGRRASIAPTQIKVGDFSLYT